MPKLDYVCKYSYVIYVYLNIPKHDLHFRGYAFNFLYTYIYIYIYEGANKQRLDCYYIYSRTIYTYIYIYTHIPKHDLHFRGHTFHFLYTYIHTYAYKNDFKLYCNYIYIFSLCIRNYT
jgi:hypothetical protein